MATNINRTFNRRLAVGATLAMAATLAADIETLGVESVGRAIIQRGIVGGGRAKFELSEANFSVFASRLILPDGQPEIVVGSIHWADAPSAFTFVSTAISDYIVLDLPPEQGQGRRIEGRMSVNGTADYPFALEVFDVGPPGSGVDTVNLVVGDGAQIGAATPPAGGYGFSYSAAGAIVAGDVQAVDFEIAEGATGVSATPVG
jgi:hypothetical protein